MEVGWGRDGGGVGGGKGVCMWICWDGGEGICGCVGMEKVEV